MSRSLKKISKGPKELHFKEDKKSKNRHSRIEDITLSDDEFNGPSDGPSEEEEVAPLPPPKRKGSTKTSEHDREKNVTEIKKPLFTLKRRGGSTLETKEVLAERKEEKKEDEIKEIKEVLGPNSYIIHYSHRKAGEDITNVFGYARVSTDMQAKKGTSITTQIERIKDRCSKDDKFNLISIAVDEGISGGKGWRERPGLNRVLRRVSIGDDFVITETTRLSRESIDSGLIKRFLRRKSIRLINLDRPMQDTPQGRILDKMEADLGDLQRELIIEKITHSMRDMSRRGVLPKKCSYGWKMDPVTKVRTKVEEEQVAIERIREFVRLHPEVKIGTMVHILNDPANGIPPHNRSLEGKEGAWYYSALKNLLIREKIPHPKVIDKIKALEEKKDYVPYNIAKEAARVRGTKIRVLKEQENGALAVRIAEILTENPGISHTDVAKALVSEGIELDSKRVIDNNLVTRLIKKEHLVEGKDPSPELKVVEFIRKLRNEDASIKVAEIIRRLQDIPPLGRGAWSHYNVKALMNKYDL